MEPVSRRAALLGTAGVVGAVVVGCAAEQPKPSPSATAAGTGAAPGTAQPSSTSTAPVDTTPRWPLTGKPLANPDDAKKIVVAVKVPDNKNEHPQDGINDADIVYVQMDGYPAVVGQTSTRLVPVYHTTYAKNVAPVRSMRPVDVPMLAPMTAIIGSTGAFPWVIKYLGAFSEYLISKKQYMTTKGTGAFSIDPKRVRKWQGQTYYDRAVVCHPNALAKLADKFTDGPQQNYFPWAADDAEVSTNNGKAAKTITVPWKKGDTYSMSYSWSEKEGRYLRSMPWGKHVQSDGKRVWCDNVLVIRAKQVFAKIDKAGKITYEGHLEPIHQIINSTGTFYYAAGGKYVTGTWTKGEVNELFQFTLEDGTPLKMAPGRTFVELPNLNTNVRIKG